MILGWFMVCFAISFFISVLALSMAYSANAYTWDADIIPLFLKYFLWMFLILGGGVLFLFVLYQGVSLIIKG